jgi:hypothetical protein
MIAIPRIRRPLGLPLLLAAALALAAAGYTAGSAGRALIASDATGPPPAAAPATALPENRILYLVPPNIEREKLPVSLPQMREFGITVVHTFADLQSRTGPGTDAIIIDRDSLPELGPAEAKWVAERFTEGMTVGGMRISAMELAPKLPVRASATGFHLMGRYTPGRVFYTVISEQVTEVTQCYGARSDYLDMSAEAGHRGLKGMIWTIDRMSEPCGLR